jgi:hypothetical protein
MQGSGVAVDDQGMPCVIKLIMDLLFGREEQLAYVTVTTR